jgi:hypothetical protein
MSALVLYTVKLLLRHISAMLQPLKLVVLAANHKIRIWNRKSYNKLINRLFITIKYARSTHDILYFYIKASLTRLLKIVIHIL